MKTECGHRLLAVLALCALLLPCLTWMLSAFGLSVRPLLDEDGWRWLFLHGTRSLFSDAVQVCFLAAVALGTLRYAGLCFRRVSVPSLALWASGSVALACMVALCLAATDSHSPLLGITGHLLPSPFLRGLPAALALTTVFTSFTYCILTMRICRLCDVSCFLTCGIRRYAGYLMASMLVSFLYACVRYSFFSNIQ